MPILRDRETVDCGAKAWLTLMATANARAVLYLMVKAVPVSADSTEIFAADTVLLTVTVRMDGLCVCIELGVDVDECDLFCT